MKGVYTYQHITCMVPRQAGAGLSGEEERNKTRKQQVITNAVQAQSK